VSVSPILFLVSAAHFFNDIYMGFLSPLYPIVMEKFGLSLSLVGAISMVAALASAFAQPLFGVLFDRFNVTAAVYLAPLLTGLFVSCLGLAPSFPVFLVLLALGSLGSAAFHPKGASVTPALSGSHPEIGMAIFSAGGNIGFAAGPAVIAFFIALFGFRATPILAAPAAAVAIVLFLLLPSRELAARTAGDARVTWRSLFADKKRLAVLVRLVSINFCITVGVRGMSTFLPVSLARSGMKVTTIGVIFTVMLALGAVASIFMASLSKRTGNRALVLASVLGGVPFAAAGLLLLPSAAGIALIVLAGAILSSSGPILLLLAQSYSGGSPAVASSLLMGVSWGIAGLLMVPLGVLGELIGIANMMLVVALFPLLATAFCLRIPRR
jgi:FSR family fosmidomycin resistance protein-like MFS transporter